MTRRTAPRRLSEEDRRLWSSVARSVTPLFGKSPPEAAEAEAPPQRPEEKPSPLARPQLEIPFEPKARPGPPQPAQIDRPTRRKLAAGRLPIDATVDLHDLTQEEAHGRLLSFLHRASAGGMRHVLVITGKGTTSGSGVLRRAVPVWLRTAAFADLVSGFEQAARHHGGSGAIYVRLSRRRQTP
jgi:DNA-nicking Smr family endonuclease